MQRRTAGVVGPSPPGQTYSFSTTTSTAISPAGGRSGGNFGRKTPHVNNEDSNVNVCIKIMCSPTFLLLVATLLTITTWLTPSDVYSRATEAEHEVLDWIKHQVNNQESNDSGEDHMMFLESKWVDGEKKLKAELKKLVELQKEGKEIGVPVLTRWLGDDIPAWAGTGVDVNEWNEKVSAAYTKMREEEEQWKLDVLSKLQKI